MKRLFWTLGGVGVAAWIVSRFLRSDFSFAGKSVVITGGSRGLGLTIARQIAAEGGRLALLARDEKELNEACDELRKIGGEAIGVPCDLLDRGQSLGAIETVMDRYGAIDVLINNAGIIEVGPLDNMRRGDFEKSMALHFWAPFNLIQQTIPHLRRAGGGRIVNISSIGGKVAVPHMSPYSASKFALVGLSDAFRAELACDGIHVTTVTPGMMRTGSHGYAKFKGNHGAEYTWFSLSTALPFAAVNAERAAAKIVAACRRGQSSLVIGLPARIGIIGNALFPSLTGEIMKLVSRILPSAVGVEGDEALSGQEARQEKSVPGWLSRLTAAAAGRQHEA
ncbi:MAG: SDR family oxidoreductase [Chthoniobacterales bacterium]|nr:SDR family oxidoreductase [Chthoniobacterales bacterium]